jgi:hypothetical protein
VSTSTTATAKWLMMHHAIRPLEAEATIVHAGDTVIAATGAIGIFRWTLDRFGCRVVHVEWRSAHG